MVGFNRVTPFPAKDAEIVSIPDNIHFLEITPPQSAAFVGAVWCAIFRCTLLDDRMCRYIFPLTADPPIQFIENNVGEQRGEDTSLRRALIGISLFTVRKHHWGFQHFLNNAQ